MQKSFIRRYSIWWIALITVVLIFLTRMLCLSHSPELHPDEHVFYLSANSLLNAILHPGTPFEEYKEYPEGAYYFHALFLLLGKVAGIVTGKEADLQEWSRIASVFYFAASVVLGMRLLERYLGKSRVSAVIYGLTMVFSVFFIEHSRYGVGDMISLMLLLLMVNLTARAMESDRSVVWWLAAFFVGGVLGAVKYPQLVFLLIPLPAFLSRQIPSRKSRVVQLLGFLVAAILGFFLFSPKAMFDPAYILRVILLEGNAYASGTPREAGGWLNHLLAMVLYTLLYADFPLLPLAATALFFPLLFRFFKARKTGTAPQGTDLLFQVIVPGVSLFFFIYNLFVPLLFFRTYTPFYGILALYTAVLAERLCCRGKIWQLALILMTGFMVLRGCWLVGILRDDPHIDNLSQEILDCVDENWEETYSLHVFPVYIKAIQDSEIPIQEFYYLEHLIQHNSGPEIQPGQLVISGAHEFYIGHEYLVPAQGYTVNAIRHWEAFKEANQDYFVTQLYPDYYYYLTGGWLRGGSFSQYEFPCHYVYYRSE